MPIAQAPVGLFTSSIIVLLISAVFLNQHIEPSRFAPVLLGFAGILGVLQPNPQSFDEKQFCRLPEDSYMPSVF